MRPVDKHAGRRAAFTIVELLTVMSIIVILIGLLVPALNKVKQYATNVKQTAQLHAIDAAIELFSNEWGGYPPSSALDSEGNPYCGAMKLAEAIMGQDLLGFHANSEFLSSGNINTSAGQAYVYTMNTLSARKGPYLQPENANAYTVEEIYGAGNIGSFLGTSRVLCDVYGKQMTSGEKTGMPILYYKANPAYRGQDAALCGGPYDGGGNIYNFWDNQDLVALGMPWGGTGNHELDPATTSGSPDRFYLNTRSEKITTPRPVRADSYILMSAGWDGEYGTADDICNYEWKYVQ